MVGRGRGTRGLGRPQRRCAGHQPHLTASRMRTMQHPVDVLHGLGGQPAGDLTRPALEQVAVQQVESHGVEILQRGVADDGDHVGVQVVAVVHPCGGTQRCLHGGVPLVEEVLDGPAVCCDVPALLVGGDGAVHRLAASRLVAKPTWSSRRRLPVSGSGPASKRYSHSPEPGDATRCRSCRHQVLQPGRDDVDAAAEVRRGRSPEAAQRYAAERLIPSSSPARGTGISRGSRPRSRISGVAITRLAWRSASACSTSPPGWCPSHDATSGFVAEGLGGSPPLVHRFVPAMLIVGAPV